eukprot:evm.model.NODE_32902_length_36922_cov_39.382481.10
MEFYQNLTNELIANGITPTVTLYHWDLPETLSKDGGWLNEETAVAFGQYADVMFQALGDRVKLWFTLNEPWTTAIAGYGQGGHAPGLKNMAENPYVAGHNQLLGHAAAVKVYREKYQEKQGGKIGPVLSTEWKEPLCHTQKDKDAAERSLIWYLAWFADPIYKGDYPEEMKARVGDRLPVFTEQQKQDLKGSADFFGINHYATNLLQGPTEKIGAGNYFSDLNGWIMMDPRWAIGDASWLSVVPWGMRRLLRWIQHRYDDPVVEKLLSYCPRGYQSHALCELHFGRHHHNMSHIEGLARFKEQGQPRLRLEDEEEEEEGKEGGGVKKKKEGKEGKEGDDGGKEGGRGRGGGEGGRGRGGGEGAGGGGECLPDDHQESAQAQR